jgi:hypothetical protein
MWKGLLQGYSVGSGQSGATRSWTPGEAIWTALYQRKKETCKLDNNIAAFANPCHRRSGSEPLVWVLARTLMVD